MEDMAYPPSTTWGNDDGGRLAQYRSPGPQGTSLRIDYCVADVLIDGIAVNHLAALSDWYSALADYLVLAYVLIALALNQRNERIARA